MKSIQQKRCLSLITIHDWKNPGHKNSLFLSLLMDGLIRRIFPFLKGWVVMIKCEIYHNWNKTNLDSSTLRSSSLTHFCHASHVGSHASHAFVQQIPQPNSQNKSVQPVQHSATATISITAVSGKVLLLACHRAKMTTGLRHLEAIFKNLRKVSRLLFTDQRLPHDLGKHLVSLGSLGSLGFSASCWEAQAESRI